jgi:3-methyladenine DNA glycosylase AlkD
MTYEEIIHKLETLASPRNVAGMARFGINPRGTLGVPVALLRKIAREAGNDHGMALLLWRSGIHEARILASLVDVAGLVTEEQMEEWAGGFDSWDVCDATCNNLFRKTAFACPKALEWSKRKEEFVKRAGFVLLATLAVHDKKADDGAFLEFLDVVEREAGDGRNFVKKAVNWALRQIGKRSSRLNAAAIEAGRRISAMDSASARWIARDALKELQGPKLSARLRD